MKLNYKIFLLFIAFYFINSNLCQSARVENVDFELVNNKLIINYDIVDFKEGDKFYVWLEIYNSFGYKIVPNYITGDVNLIIPGGINKNVIWNLFKDKPDFNDEIFIKVYALKYYSYQKLLTLSALYPGMGDSKINQDNKYLIIGGAAYAGLISSVLFDQIAKSSYNKYKVEVNPEKRKQLYNHSNGKRHISNLCIITTSGIWLGSIAYTYFDKFKFDKKLKNPYTISLSLNHYNNENLAMVPQLSAKIKF